MSDPAGVFAGASTAVAALVLLAEFLLLRSQLLASQVRVYAMQSLVVSVLAGIVAADRGLPDLYALAAVSFLFKVVAVPLVVRRLLRDAETEIAAPGAFGVATEVLVGLVAAAVGFFGTDALQISSADLPGQALGLAVAVVLVSFVVIVVRADVVSQAMGFFSLENGVSLASLVVAAGLPLILEVAFLFDLLVAVVVFGVLMRAHYRRATTLSTAGLTQLRG